MCENEGRKEMGHFDSMVELRLISFGFYLAPDWKERFTLNNDMLITGLNLLKSEMWTAFLNGECWMFNEFSVHLSNFIGYWLLELIFDLTINVWFDGDLIWRLVGVDSTLWKQVFTLYFNGFVLWNGHFWPFRNYYARSDYLLNYRQFWFNT